MNDKIAVTTSCWGTYWDRFGAEFINSMEQCQPAEVSIVTNQKIVVPSWFTVNRPRSEIQMWDWTNEAVENCHSEWVVVAGIDDIYFANAFENIELAGDIVSIVMQEHGVPLVRACHEEWNSKILLESVTGVWTPIILRREVFLKYPWRRVGAPDSMQLVELRYHNLSITFDNTPRFEHITHTDSYSVTPCPRAMPEILTMKRMLATGKVIPGAEWPPLGSNWCEIKPDISRVMKMFELRRNRMKR